jgi:hypothetical protein
VDNGSKSQLRGKARPETAAAPHCMFQFNADSQTGRDITVRSGY